MALSMSVSGGAVNARHDLDPDYRARLKNVDRSKTKDNLILANESIERAYERLFGEATATYNARQVSKGRPDRQIEDYYAHVRDAYRADRAKVGHSKSRSGRPAPAIEYVVQLGNRETWSRELDEAGAKAVYSDAFDRIKERTAGAIDWFAAAVHVDETDGTPHMHIIGIPYGQSPNRGLPVQVSMNKALKTMGLDRLPDLQDAMMGCLESVAREHGVERAVIDDHHKHMDVPQFKRAMRELDELDKRRESSRREASDLARLADVTRGLVKDAQAEERERSEGAARAEQHRKDLLDCWGAHIDEETLQEGRRDHTAYQWCDLGFVPIAEARWRLTRYGGNSAWYYCSPWDVRYDPDRAKELLETGPREYDRLPDGRPYDGRPWWQA